MTPAAASRAIAAVLVGGVAIGRYVVPVAPTTVAAADSAQGSTDRARNAAGLGPDALAELPAGVQWVFISQIGRAHV